MEDDDVVDELAKLKSLRIAVIDKYTVNEPSHWMECVVRDLGRTRRCPKGNSG